MRSNSLLMGSETMAARIAQQAVRCFYKHGFQATTMREIAEACRITPAAIYKHFPSKNELFYKAVQDGHKIIDCLISEALVDAYEPDDQLRFFIKALLRFHMVYRFEALVLNDEIRFLRHNQLEQLVVARKRLLHMFADILSDGENADKFQIPRPHKKDAIPFIAMALISLCVRVANWYDPNGLLSIEEAEELIAELILKSVRKS